MPQAAAICDARCYRKRGSAKINPPSSALTQTGLKRVPKKNSGAERYKKRDRQLEHLEIPVYQPLIELPMKGSVFQQCFIAWGKWFRARFTAHAAP